MSQGWVAASLACPPAHQSKLKRLTHCALWVPARACPGSAPTAAQAYLWHSMMKGPAVTKQAEKPFRGLYSVPGGKKPEARRHQKGLSTSYRRSAKNVQSCFLGAANPHPQSRIGILFLFVSFSCLRPSHSMTNLAGFAPWED